MIRYLYTHGQGEYRGPQRRTALVAKELSWYNIDIAVLSDT